jgi:hypothetical protein
MKDDIIVVVAVVETVTEKAEAQDGIRSRSSSRAYNEGWERIFGSKDAKAPAKEDLN